MRPWPLRGATRLLLIITGIVGWIHGFDHSLLKLGSFILLLTLVQWWRDVCREGTFQGKHSSQVERGLRVGMLLFILREVCFFASFFWAFFHSSLHPAIRIDKWPPAGIKPINPIEMPLLNTTILLARGFTITWTHHAITQSQFNEALAGFATTTFLGALFTALQFAEYFSCPFALSDSVYGGTFYVATGFHGVHVIIGTLFICVIWARHLLSHFSVHRHFGFEASAWYWHFVDVIWLFLFISLYWWGFE